MNRREKRNWWRYVRSFISNFRTDVLLTLELKIQLVFDAKIIMYLRWQRVSFYDKIAFNYYYTLPEMIVFSSIAKIISWSASERLNWFNAIGKNKNDRRSSLPDSIRYFIWHSNIAQVRRLPFILGEGNKKLRFA